MATFTPPTETYPVTVRGKHPLNRLMAHYGSATRGRNVFYLSDGTVTETDPDSITVFWTNQGNGLPYVVQAWYGSVASPYTVTSAQATALTAAGYTVS